MDKNKKVAVIGNAHAGIDAARRLGDGATQSEELFKGTFRFSDHDEEAMDDQESFFLVAQIEYPNFGYLATQDEVIEILETMKENGDDGEQIAITHKLMTQREYEALPEFKGF